MCLCVSVWFVCARACVCVRVCVCVLTAADSEERDAGRPVASGRKRLRKKQREAEADDDLMLADDAPPAKGAKATEPTRM